MVGPVLVLCAHGIIFFIAYLYFYFLLPSIALNANLQVKSLSSPNEVSYNFSPERHSRDFGLICCYQYYI